MKWAGILILFLIAGCGQAGSSSPAVSPPAVNDNAELEKTLWDVDQQWLCSGPYGKSYKDCVQFRSKYWVDQFFEVIPSGELLNKEEMVATQAARIPSNPDPRTAPYPDAFKLRAFYGNFAMATDHTNFKTADKNGKLAFTSNSKVLRLFVKENGTWRPAAAGFVANIVSPVPPRPGKRSATPHKEPEEKTEKEPAEAERAWRDFRG